MAGSPNQPSWMQGLAPGQMPPGGMPSTGNGMGLPDPLLQQARYKLNHPNAGDGFSASAASPASAQAQASNDPNALMLAAMLQGLQQAPNGQVNPALLNALGKQTQLNNPLAAKELNSRKSNNKPPATDPTAFPPPPAEPQPSPNALLGSMLGGVGLSYAGTKLFDAYEGKNAFGHGRYVHTAGSPLAKTARFFSEGGPFKGLNRWLEKDVYPTWLEANPGLRQTLVMEEKGLAHWAERADTRYLKAELEAFEKALSSPQYRDGIYKNLATNMGLEDLLLKPPTQWHPWQQQAVLEDVLSSNLKQLDKRSLLEVFGELKRQAPSTALPQWSNSGKQLQQLITKKDSRALQWLQEQLQQPLGNSNNTIAKTISKRQFSSGGASLPTLHKRFAEHLDALAINPNPARAKVFQVFQKKAKASYGSTIGKLQGSLNTIQQQKLAPLLTPAGWRPRPTEQQRRALEEAVEAVYNTVKDQKFTVSDKVRQQLQSKQIQDPKALQNLMKALKLELTDKAAKDKQLFKRLDGFFGRSNHTLFTHHNRHYADLNKLALMEKGWVWRQRMASEVLKNHGITDPAAIKKLNSLLQAAQGGNKAARTQWVQQLANDPSIKNKLSAAARKTLSNELDDVHRLAMSAKRINGVGRLYVALHNHLRRIISGEIIQDLFVSPGAGSNASQGGLGKMMSGPLMGKAGGMLQAGLLLYTPFVEMAKAEGPIDKARSFTREFVGGVLGLLSGWAVAQHLAGAFKMAPALLGKASTRKMPLGMTLGRLVIELVVGGIIGSVLSSVGKRATDALIGKPHHELEKDAYEKQKKIFERAQRQRKRLGLPPLQPPASYSPSQPGVTAPLPSAGAQSLSNPSAATKAPPSTTPAPLSSLTPDAIAQSRPAQVMQAAAQSMAANSGNGGMFPAL